VSEKLTPTLPAVLSKLESGYQIRVPKDATLPSRLAAIRDSTDAKELQARVFPQNQGEQALASAITRIRPGAAGSLNNNFAVVDEEGNQSIAQGVGDCLGRYQEALEQQFKLALPPDIVTVYEVKDVGTVIDEAAKLHGVALPFGTIAYSSFDDLSLVGVGSPTQCGSLAHEVVHLMMKYSVGNTAPWLEEGLASEVAVASAAEGNFKFGFSWRDDMLHTRWAFKPRLGDLLNMGWNDFAANDERQLERVAAIQAMAAVFIRYLAEKNKLTDVFFAVRNKHYSADFSEVQSYQKVLEQSLGKTTDEIDRDFSSWFSREVERPQHAGTSRAGANERAVQCAPGPQQECRPIPNENMNTASPNAQHPAPPPQFHRPEQPGAGALFRRGAKAHRSTHLPRRRSPLNPQRGCGLRRAPAQPVRAAGGQLLSATGKRA